MEGSTDRASNYIKNHVLAYHLGTGVGLSWYGVFEELCLGYVHIAKVSLIAWVE